ncbi:sugar ABC transporter permease [Microvirga vignae]|uniref:Sugar ABC transporter permease n=1 Tax=Microvirga vignae TaxID=1225564 RepID=A0A0H1RP12_9HYPH|nr:ABC transporter permease [Microvirga vignae]KLK94397.1 sugar ABC transporter permease [Microvirga vignae]
MSAPIDMPKWADTFLVPAISVAAAFLIAGLVVLSIGENPLTATRYLLQGSLGTGEGLGFTLFYATDFIFVGLAVAVAYHAGLFNIGGEGQATLAGLGIALALNNLTFLPGFLLIPIGIIAAAAFGAAWAAVPGYLQAKRGSHIVITTIMFNWLASVLIVYLLVNVLREPQSMNPETRAFPEGSYIPFMHEMFAAFGIDIPSSQLNLTFVLALISAYLIWLLIYRSRLGYAIRVVGSNPMAAIYAGISPARITIIAMVLSGALAGGLAVNELMGYQHRLLLEFTSGYGFVGIAVALMGRAHPVGIILASLLFGILYQGGAELAFEQPNITRDMVVVIGGIIILFAGALDGLFRRLVAQLLSRPKLAGA